MVYGLWLKQHFNSHKLFAAQMSHFKFEVCEADRPTPLPVDMISNWFNRSLDGSNYNSTIQKQTERFLQIEFGTVTI